MSRHYKVFLKDKTEFTVDADDVDLQCCNDCGENEENCHAPTHHYIFLVGEITVASIPFDLVHYVTV